MQLLPSLLVQLKRIERDGSKERQMRRFFCFVNSSSMANTIVIQIFTTREYCNFCLKFTSNLRIEKGGEWPFIFCHSQLDLRMLQGSTFTFECDHNHLHIHIYIYCIDRRGLVNASQKAQRKVGKRKMFFVVVVK